MPIEATNGLSGVSPPIAAPCGALLFISASRAASGFSSKPLMWPSASKRKIPIWVASVGVDRLRRDGDVGLALDVRVDQLAEVHPVEVVAGQDQVVLRLVRREVARRLAHRVGRALEPVGVVGRLLGGEHLDEAVGEEIEPVGLRDVAVERRRVELRQHEDLLQPGVQAVADRDVDQPVLAADRHRRLRPHVGERVEPRPASAAENQRQHVVHAPSLTEA